MSPPSTQGRRNTIPLIEDMTYRRPKEAGGEERNKRFILIPALTKGQKHPPGSKKLGSHNLGRVQRG